MDGPQRDPPLSQGDGAGPASAAAQTHAIRAATPAGAAPEVSDSEEGFLVGVGAGREKSLQKEQPLLDPWSQRTSTRPGKNALVGLLESAFLSFQRNWLKEPQERAFSVLKTKFISESLTQLRLSWLGFHAQSET